MNFLFLHKIEMWAPTYRLQLWESLYWVNSVVYKTLIAAGGWVCPLFPLTSLPLDFCFGDFCFVSQLPYCVGQWQNCFLVENVVYFLNYVNTKTRAWSIAGLWTEAMWFRSCQRRLCLLMCAHLEHVTHGSESRILRSTARPEPVRVGETPIDAAHAIPASFGSCSTP